MLAQRNERDDAYARAPVVSELCDYVPTGRVEECSLAARSLRRWRCPWKIGRTASATLGDKGGYVTRGSLACDRREAGWRLRSRCERLSHELADDAVVCLVYTRAAFATERLNMNLCRR